MIKDGRSIKDLQEVNETMTRLWMIFIFFLSVFSNFFTTNVYCSKEKEGVLFVLTVLQLHTIIGSAQFSSVPTGPAQFCS